MLISIINNLKFKVSEARLSFNHIIRLDYFLYLYIFNIVKKILNKK